MYTFVNFFLNPFNLFFLITGLGIANLWRRRRESRRRLLLLTAPFLAMAIIFTPAASFLALGSLEWQYPPLAQRPAGVQALVVLSGDLDPPNDSRAYAVLGMDTFHRCLYAATLYRQGPPCLVFLSGGKVDPKQRGPTLAAAMRDFLLTQGIPVERLVIEDRSRTTYENAVETTRLLQQRGIDEIVLISDAAHLSRGVRCFQRQGVRVVPAGCRYRTADFKRRLSDFWPSLEGAGKIREACHEWLGRAWYSVRGRI